MDGVFRFAPAFASLICAPSANASGGKAVEERLTDSVPPSRSVTAPVPSAPVVTPGWTHPRTVMSPA